MQTRTAPSGGAEDTATDRDTQPAPVFIAPDDADELHRSFYATFDPEPDLSWMDRFLDRDALGGDEE